MKILHVAEKPTGGAAVAMLRLHRGLLAIGEDSSVLVAKGNPTDRRMRVWKGRMDPLSRLQRRTRKMWLKRCAAKRASGASFEFDLFSDDRTRFGNHIADALNEVDVVNFHWVARFVDYSKLLPKLEVPVVYTLHDESAFTGGCHYDSGCERWKEGCGKCPQLGSTQLHDFSARAWDRKRKAYRKIGSAGMTIVTPSKWLGNLASQSPLLDPLNVETIPYGVPTDIFCPMDRGRVREKLGLKKEDRVILFVAEWLDNKRKGFSVLAEALDGLEAPNGRRLVLLSVGGRFSKELSGHVHVPMGAVESEETMAEIYNSADLFVAPSLQDNLPNTVLESLACGTPVVGSDAGGIPDMVRHGETGWLFEVGNSESLRDVLSGAIESDDCVTYRSRCREVVLEEYPMHLQAERYRELYRESLSGRVEG
ncbi:MAG: glycosyltransferase [Puniceicoccales bacterium]